MYAPRFQSAENLFAGVRVHLLTQLTAYSSLLTRSLYTGTHPSHRSQIEIRTTYSLCAHWTSVEKLDRSVWRKDEAVPVDLGHIPRLDRPVTRNPPIPPAPKCRVEQTSLRNPTNPKTSRELPRGIQRMLKYGQIGHMLQGWDEVLSRRCGQHRLLSYRRQLYRQSDWSKYGIK